MPLDLAAIREKLESMRDELRRGQEAGEADRAPVELDQTSVGRLSRIDAMQVQAMAMANQQRRKAELERILAALRRIDEDDFGYCSVCGEAISEARIMHVPAAAMCIGCAA